MAFRRVGLESAAARIEAALAEGAPEAAYELLAELQAEDGRSVYFEERDWIVLGYGYLRERKPELAVAVFHMATEAFPDAWNTWDSLGEAHLEAGEHRKAIECYERSVELNPDNDNGRQQMERIAGTLADLEAETKQIQELDSGAETEE